MRMAVYLCGAALFSGCASVSKSKQAQVQTAVNQSLSPVKYGAIQRANASRGHSVASTQRKP